MTDAANLIICSGECTLVRVDDTDRAALWLACFVPSMAVPFPEYFLRTRRQESWWEADGVIVDVVGHFPSYAELRDFRTSWRHTKLHQVANERRLTREAVSRAWGMLWMDSWWDWIRQARRDRPLTHWGVDDPDEE